MNLPLGGIGKLQGDNVGMSLNGKRKNSLLPLVYLGQLEDGAIKVFESNVELRSVGSE